MKKWEILQDELITKDNVTDILLKNRFVVGEKEREEFLYPDLENVTIDSVGIERKELQIALDRIHKAIEKKERIIIYGDYDVDGITGAAILWESILSIGGNVLPYIPHRVDEGYGLSIKGIDHILSDIPDVSLIITVDNGIVATKAVSYAHEKGIDVIITDHHVEHADESHAKPDAVAIVHTTKLCGAGVGYMLSRELLGIQDEKGGPEDMHLELVALATIADLVPLTGANRVFAKYGMEKLAETKRPGLLALFSASGIDKNTIDVYTIGHHIAPRLNAAGRLESAMDSLRLLCTHDKNRAYKLAEYLQNINAERQAIMKESATHGIGLIQAQVPNHRKVLIIGDASYPQGVIGLVAGKLVEEFYRPAIVFSIGEEFSKASARSVNGFNIIEFIRLGAEYFIDAGGHPMAAGITVETAKLPQLKAFLEEQAENLITDEHLMRMLKIDGKIDLTTIDDAFYEEIRQLEPYGMGNPEPVFVAENVSLVDVKLLGREGKHMKLFCVKEHGKTLEAVAFGMGERFDEIRSGKTLNLAFSVDENIWNGRRTLQLKIKDIKIKD